MADEEITLDESWETETGLLDEYTGTIVRSWFATDARYQDGAVILLHWEIQTTDPDTPEVLEKFPVGGGWDSPDGGTSVVHEKGKQKFNKNSIYGKIVDRVTSSDGVLHDVAAVVRGRGRPTNASIWDGLTFQFKREEFDYGGDIGKKSRVMPIKFLGENAQPALALAPSTTTEAPAPAAAPVTSDVDPVVLAKLTNAAKASDSHQAFLDAAMEIDGVTTNNDLMAQLVDDSATGFYALAQG
jgi:hypothetical protein